MIFGPAGNRRFLGSGRPRGPGKPFKIWGANVRNVNTLGFSETADGFAAISKLQFDG